jgi:Holliday junction resolvasome RuvABC endonuclease subunit
MSALVLGIDPGPKNNGWAVVDFTVPSAPLWFAGGTCESMVGLLERFAQYALGHPERPCLVAIERPRALHNPLANVAVMGTAWAGGFIAGYAEALHFPVLELGQNEWRLALVGHSVRGDDVGAKVKAFLARHVRDLPARTSEHARDAAAVACVGYRVSRQRPGAIGGARG